jgi:hypothetical protein
MTITQIMEKTDDDNGSELHAVCANDMGRVRAAIEQLIAE